MDMSIGACTCTYTYCALHNYVISRECFRAALSTLALRASYLSLLPVILSSSVCVPLQMLGALLSAAQAVTLALLRLCRVCSSESIVEFS